MSRLSSQFELKDGSAPRGLGFSALAMGVALIGTLVHATDAPVWRADAALLSGEQTGSITGDVFPWLSRTLRLLPLGSHTLRAALIGAVASAAAAAVLCQLIIQVLAVPQGPRRMDPWLALSASLSVVFSFPFITDATLAGGGAAPAAALALGLLAWCLRPTPQRGVGLAPATLAEGCTVGALFGLLLGESPWCGIGLLLVAASLWRRGGTRRAWMGLSLAALLTALAILVPRALLLTESELAALRLLPEAATWPPLPASAYLDQIGFVGAAGVLVALAVPGPDARARLTLSCLLLVGLDLAIPAQPSSAWLQVVEPQPARSALHLLALGGLAILSTVGLRRLADVLSRYQLVAAEKSAALLTLLALGAAVAGIEDASRLLSQTEAAGPTAWTSAALHPLPYGSVVLTHRPAVSSRLKAAQKQGERPDVLVVPLDSLAQAGKLGEWLEEEPALKQLIVDMSVDGTPSERALNLLSDKRSVFIEPDPSWDRRLLEHLHPTLPLAPFSAHAIGRSDRQQSIDENRAELARIFEATQLGLYPDHATRQVLARGLVDLSAILETIGDTSTQKKLSASVPPLLADLALLPREDSKDARERGLGDPQSRALVAK